MSVSRDSVWIGAWDVDSNRRNPRVGRKPWYRIVTMRLFALLALVALSIGCVPHEVAEVEIAQPQQPVKNKTVTIRNQDGSTRVVPAPDLQDAPDIAVEPGDDGRYKITFSAPKPPPKGAAETDEVATVRVAKSEVDEGYRSRYADFIDNITNRAPVDKSAPKIKVSPFDPADPYTMRLILPDATIAKMRKANGEAFTDWAWSLLDDDRAVVYMQSESGNVLAVTSYNYHEMPPKRD